VSAIFVHGFDIPLAQKDGFDAARRRAAEATAYCRVPLTVIGTNFREFVEPWTSVFGSALAAVLHQFSGLANVGIIAADVDYSRVILPWGSNLVTNGLLSSSR
jgi:hypothetical protein